ncbi:hypothetical protein ENBRE01_1074 [Enteropsectra breve]|nr:hypothetical protein ENBRE01_1074 [Enteropsectra breve]
MHRTANFSQFAFSRQLSKILLHALLLITPALSLNSPGFTEPSLHAKSAKMVRFMAASKYFRNYIENTESFASNSLCYQIKQMLAHEDDKNATYSAALENLCNKLGKDSFISKIDNIQVFKNFIIFFNEESKEHNIFRAKHTVYQPLACEDEYIMSCSRHNDYIYNSYLTFRDTLNTSDLIKRAFLQVSDFRLSRGGLENDVKKGLRHVNTHISKCVIFCATVTRSKGRNDKNFKPSFVFQNTSKTGAKTTKKYLLKSILYQNIGKSSYEVVQFDNEKHIAAAMERIFGPGKNMSLFLLYERAE